MPALESESESAFPAHFVPTNPYASNPYLPQSRSALDHDDFEPYVNQKRGHEDPGLIHQLGSHEEDSSGGDLQRPWYEPEYLDIPRSPLWRPNVGRTYPRRSTRYAGSYL